MNSQIVCAALDKVAVDISKNSQSIQHGGLSKRLPVLSFNIGCVRKKVAIAEIDEKSRPPTIDWLHSMPLQARKSHADHCAVGEDIAANVSATESVGAYTGLVRT